MKASRPVRSHATRTLTPVVLCLPEYSSGMVRHDQVGSRVPSTVSGSVGSRSYTVGRRSCRACPRMGVQEVYAQSSSSLSPTRGFADRGAGYE